MSWSHAGIAVMLGCSTVVMGCENWSVCINSVQPGIVVEIRDVVDGRPIAPTASGMVSDGSFQDSLRLYDRTLQRASAYERPGLYRVRVSHPGYVMWERTGVRVRDSGCHVDMVTLQASLERMP
jgi:hypothetical protein